jgi:hypothetical protein
MRAKVLRRLENWERRSDDAGAARGCQHRDERPLAGRGGLFRDGGGA